MNKLVIASVAAFVAYLVPESAAASACGPVCQKGYQTARGHGGYYNSGYGYGGYNNYNQPVIIIPRERKRKGDPCYAANGAETAYDPRTKRRYVVPGTGTGQQPARVSASCSGYEAEMTQGASNEAGVWREATINGQLHVCKTVAGQMTCRLLGS